MSTPLPLDPTIMRKYQTSGPRYTSYPTALAFDEQFYNDDLLKAVKTSLNRQLSLYIHIPFCHQLCYYCGCNKIITRHASKADEYLAVLEQEIRNRAALFTNYQVTQLHLGGGSPSFLTPLQLGRLKRTLREAFRFADTAELSIEIDPRRISEDYVDTLVALGFNRLSIGVQDTSEKVQKAINRVQSTPFIHHLVNRATALGMGSVNLDIIYGLPHQTPETFTRTLDDVIAMQPQRISLFSYAHLPERFAAQRKIHDSWLPDAEQKLALMALAIERFTAEGYAMVGMDHFARPDDPLALAAEQKRLRRNFQGYTCLEDCDLLGLGVSSISHINNCFSQNHKQLNEYYAAVLAGGHAVERGVTLSADDQVRAYVIESLMCNLRVNKTAVEHRFDVDFDQYFAEEQHRVRAAFDESLVEVTDTHIRLASHARLLVRNLCMHFDAYLQGATQQRYSSTI